MKRAGPRPDGARAKRTVQPKHDLLSSLPADILRMIMSYIPVRPRLIVLALVSKKFLHLSRETVTCLPAMRLHQLASGLSILPNVAALAYLPIGMPLTTLRRLRSISCCSSIMRQEELAELTNLTSLFDFGGYSTLIRDNSSTLTELGLRLSADMEKCPRDINLPVLTRFKLSSSLSHDHRHNREVAECLLVPVSQLTSFTLLSVGLTSFSELAPLQMLPKLRHLSSSLEIVLQLLPNCPNLASVHAYCSSTGNCAELSRLAHLDVSVKFGNYGNFASALPALACLPRLSLLSCFYSSEFNVSQFTSLTTLVTNWFQPTGPMPKLEHIRFRVREVGIARRSVEIALRNCPRLRVIQLECNIWTIRDMNAVVKVLRAAERCGVEEFTFIKQSSDQLGRTPEMISKFSRSFKWMRLSAPSADDKIV